MNQSNKTELKERDPDEIDVIDLVLQLWRGKWLIALCVLLGVVLSGTYIVLTPEKWSSTAIVTRPDTAQVAGYTYAMSVLDGKSGFDARDIELRLINRFSSAFSALADTLRNQVKPEKLTIEPTAKGQPLPLKLSYQGSSPQAAQAQLSEYIQQTDRQIADELELNLRESLQQKIAALKSTLETQEKIAQEQKDLHIEQIKEALKFAQAANITQPQERQGNNVNQDTLFLLGSEALMAMVERESTRPLTYPDDYFQTRQQLLAIEGLNTDKISISAYRYVLKPTLPITRDSPKKTLSIVLGLLLGGMVGCGVVLGRNALREYKAHN